jgi:hypothetical protein
MGIVAMQVEVLKLGATMGRAIERGSALQSRNELLRANASGLADDQRIERLAAGMGMVMPQPAVVGFLTARKANAGRAAANIHASSAGAFLAALSSLATTASGPVSGGSTTTGTPASGPLSSGSATTTPSGALSSGAASTTSSATSSVSASTPGLASQSSSSQGQSQSTPAVGPVQGAPTTSSGGATATSGG